MRVRFILRKARLNKLGQCPLDCHIRVSGIPSTPFSTSIMVAPSKWDSKFQRIKGSSDHVHSQNKKLDQIRNDLETIRDTNLARGRRLTAKEVVDIYHGKREVSCNFLTLCQKKIDDLRSQNRSASTIQIHKKCHLYLLGYLKENMLVEDIERRHVSGFWQYLKDRGYNHDYVNKTVANCISLFRFAVKKGYSDHNPFAGISFTWINEVDLTCLNEEEIERLKTYTWSETLQKVVDSFLFMCYQGMHIADYQKLTDDHLSSVKHVQWIRIGRTKTKVQASIPLHSESAKIIAKYGGMSNLPKLSGQKSNEYLKIIAERIGTEKHLTNKIARKTFTNMCINDYGMSDESVAAMLGHTSTRFVKKYGAVSQKRIISEWKDKIEVA
ncbi:site-specific integrase [Dyadobacter sp. CY347]|uniref:site-specific integrase n=1 Tax=Dyadobacter sp. CY347 TaxID=2909336 RepID=UPI001F407032|nr:site-specific integrase [Dyadobacter sp. CY347]MCF2487449.1 site-specific integrase [Dyadobacter sp. CY347]